MSTSTKVRGTLIANGRPLRGWSYYADFIEGPGEVSTDDRGNRLPTSINGNQFDRHLSGGVADPFGHFVLDLPPNTLIVPEGSKWRITFLPPSMGKGFSVDVVVADIGDQNISSEVRIPDGVL